MLVPVPAAPAMRGIFCPVAGSSSPNSTAFFSSSGTCFFEAASQLGIGGRASSLRATTLGSTYNPFLPTSNWAYCGADGCVAATFIGEPATGSPPPIIGAGAWYP